MSTDRILIEVLATRFTFNNLSEGRAVSSCGPRPIIGGGTPSITYSVAAHFTNPDRA